jgi:hypothetical protein
MQLQSERVRRRLSVEVTARPDMLDRNETGETLKTSGGEAELYMEREEWQ